MKRYAFLLFVFICLMPCAVFAQTYKSLWDKFGEAKLKDLPKTQILVLEQIESKASIEQDYGQLLCAELLRVTAQTNIAPDSLNVMVERLVEKERDAEQTDKVLAAVYQSILGRIYGTYHSLSDDYAKISADYFAKSMSNPALLAEVQTSTYEPFVVNGIDSKVFNNDLLHVIGFAANNYKTLHDYYLKISNSPAACLTGLMMLQHGKKDASREVEKSKYLQSIDSLLNVYKGLNEAGEIAIEHYNFMVNSTDATAEDKYNYINYALSQWGTWPHMNELRNAQKDLTRPSFDVSVGSEVSLPNKPRKVFVNSLRNITTLTVNVYKVNVGGDTKLTPSNSEDYAKLKPLLTLVPNATQSVSHIGQPVYKELTDSMFIPGLPIGVYMVEFTADNKDIKPQRALLHVSDMYVVSQELPNKTYRIAAVSATTGQPIHNAKIRLKTEYYNNEYKTEIVTLTCGANGETTYKYKENRPYLVYAYTADDKSAPETNFGGYYSYYKGEKNNVVTSLYTDRSIYRPRQTVHVSAIVFDADGKGNNHAKSNVYATLTMRDVNNKEIGTAHVITDYYGTASTDFVLPQNTLTGRFTISGGLGNSGYAYITVEEYKRPTFQVEFDKDSTAYQRGDTVTITGRAKTYAGVPVQGAKVAYSVSRRQAIWWWYRMPNAYDNTVKQDTVKTAEDGSFKVRVPMIMPEGAGEKYPSFFSFDVEANVTDIGGETHAGFTSLPLGTDPTAFYANMTDKMERDSVNNVVFAYKNNAGQNIDGEVTYWLDDVKYTCKSNTSEMLNISGMLSALHHLVAICGNDTIKKDFVVFSMDDNQPATSTHDWFYQSATSFANDGKPVYIQVGASDENQHILYTIISEGAVIESGVIDQSNAVNTHKFTYKPEYGDGILIAYTWVREGKVYIYNATIKRPLPDKRLLMKWTTFRNKLTSGQKEEWTLRIIKPDGTPVKAQLLATMFDKSLDQIRPHYWSFSDMTYMNIPYSNWAGQYYNVVGLNGYMSISLLGETGLDFDHFDPETFYFYQPYSTRSPRMLRGMVSGIQINEAADGEVLKATKAVVQPNQELKTQDQLLDSKAVIGSFDVAQVPQPKPTDANQVRENLNETAFFYPTLLTDVNGDVAVKFTLPESVTTWRFMGLAHDEEMNNGIIEGEAVASKTVMVQPNVPRFVRAGDNATVSTRIFNTSDNEVSGTATMQLIDLETDNVLYEESNTFTVKANGTSSASFSVDLSDNSQLSNTIPSVVICRIVANGAGYSDGEQHYLPILSNKELATVTVPFTQNKPGIKEIDVDTLFAVKENTNKLTVEYTNNPAWLMVQALPSLANTYSNDAISQAAAYYSNSIANNILHQTPQIKQVIEVWRNETGTETSLMSSLGKDQELKTVLLNETPWVFEADNESDQKQQLINFFDENNVSNRLSDNIQKLSNLQRSDGSWSWWDDMPGNVYITMTVSEMLVRLNTMIGKQSETNDMIVKAFGFLDKYTLDEVAQMKRNEKKEYKNVMPSETVINYLYIRSLSDVMLTSKMISAKDYLIKHLENKTDVYTIYGKAIMANVLAKFGNIQKAKTYLQSIREYTVYTEEKGRYFDTPKAYYSWFDYRIPTEVAAIEAIKALQPGDTATIEEMQRWLLQSKRTQSWDTPINTVNAVYAFLDSETDKLTGNNEQLTVLSVDGKVIDLPKSTAGLGYVRTSVKGNNMKTFTANKTSAGTSWGSVYAQFIQKTTDIANSSSGISVKKEIILPKGKSQLNVGDRITVRITINAERDYDFVQVVDKRAACMEPAQQLSGYGWGYYCTPLDNSTNYYFDRLSKGKHIIESEYYIDRAGEYQTGTCKAQCAYSPEYIGQVQGIAISVK